MLQEIKEIYADATGKTPRPWAMLGYPGKILWRATNEDIERKSTQYHSIMGKLMYYMTKVGLDSTSAVRELAG